ncbi:conserved protein [Candidatus Moduliflexus flocculans]|uniref:Conserved protein n=1 Tax=Candidatus Moduliflexus flocculans TaxID=1499966 RepID=A0A081BSU1_9BACT|nr:conserved protein [Candidatus Moduliflexus flocculans]
MRVWYLFFLTLGWGSFPLAFAVFQRFPDRGFALSKIFGLFCVSYAIWLSASLNIAPYTSSTITLFLAIFGILNGIFLLLHRRAIWQTLKTHIPLFLLIEAIFAGVFFVALAIRMYNPDITGAEKEPDFMLMNAMLRTESFPPKDSWFAGEFVNYYYFGYVIWATVIKALGEIAPIGFNLALATIPALSAAASFGLVYHWTRHIAYGLFSSFLLVVAANMDGLIQIIQRGHVFPFDWWRSSRIIPDTINEFPYFSFLLGDLHAHFMAIPFLALLIALLSAYVDGGSRYVRIPQFFFVGLALGSAAFINTWDYPPAVILAACGMFAAIRASRQAVQRSLLTQLVMSAGLAVALIAISRVAFWPFYQHFTPQLSLKNLRVVAAAQRTGILDFLKIYALFLAALMPMALSMLLENLPTRQTSKEITIITINFILLGSVFWWLGISVRVVLLTAIFSLIFFVIWHRALLNNAHADLPLLLISLAFAILAGCEIFYIQDFYGHPLERQNTIFKFTYHAWILLSLGTPVVLFRTQALLQTLPRKIRIGWRGSLAALCGVCLIYPACATFEKTNHFRGEKQGGLFYLPTLNGIGYIVYNYPQEYEALMWIQQHLDRQAVILEATGNPYSFFGRVSATTGRITVLGWGNHEALWRDPTWKSITERTDEIRQMYENIDKSAILPLLQKYQINYIYVGTLERQTYDNAGLDAFAADFPVVYRNPLITIYEVNPARMKKE